MTPIQEEESIARYKERAAVLLQSGDAAGCHALCRLCREPLWHFLMQQDEELRVLFLVMYIWDKEIADGHSQEASLIGRTAAFLQIPSCELTYRQLIDIYTILKFMIFRLESDLPVEVLKEGIERVLVLDVTPEAILLASENEAINKNLVIKKLTDLLPEKPLCLYPSAAGIREFLSAWLTWSSGSAGSAPH